MMLYNLAGELFKCFGITVTLKCNVCPSIHPTSHKQIEKTPGTSGRVFTKTSS